MRSWKEVAGPARTLVGWLRGWVVLASAYALLEIAYAADMVPRSQLNDGVWSDSAGDYIDPDTGEVLADSGVPYMSWADGVDIIFGLAQFAAMVVLAVLVIRLLYRLHDNARWYGLVRHSGSSRGWIGWGWFVPIANLWIPYRKVRDIRDSYAEPAPGDDATTMRSGPGEGRPASEDEVRAWQGPPSLGWWWATWLFWTIVGSRATTSEMSGADPRTVDIAYAASDIISVISALLLIGIVRWLAARHALHLAAWQQRQADA